MPNGTECSRMKRTGSLSLVFLLDYNIARPPASAYNNFKLSPEKVIRMNASLSKAARVAPRFLKNLSLCAYGLRIGHD
jgi:hypothetical protein